MARNKSGETSSNTNGHRVTKEGVRCGWGGLGTGEHRCDVQATWCQYVRHVGGVAFYYYCAEHRAVHDERRRLGQVREEQRRASGRTGGW